MSSEPSPEVSAEDEGGGPASPTPGWLIWSVAGGFGGAVAGAAVASFLPTQLGPLSADPGLPLWTWSGLNGLLVGVQSGVACFLWGLVRRGDLNMFWGATLIPLLTASLLTIAFCLTTSIAGSVTGQPALLPTGETLPAVFWGNLAIGCALLGALVGHVAARAPWYKMLGAWFMTLWIYMPLGALGILVHGREPAADFFWRVGFPYYLVLPFSWWVASLVKPDPLPPQEEEG